MNHLDGSDDDNTILNFNDTVLFKVGSFCKSRTRLYHSFLHFKFKIFYRILTKLTGAATNIYFLNSLPQHKGLQGLRKKHQEVNAERRSKRLSTCAKEIIKDESFISDGFRTYNFLLGSTEADWGLSGEDQIGHFRISLWEDPVENVAKASEAEFLLDEQAENPPKNSEAQKEPLKSEKKKRKHKEKREKKCSRIESDHQDKASEHDTDRGKGRGKQNRSKEIGDEEIKQED